MYKQIKFHTTDCYFYPFQISLSSDFTCKYILFKSRKRREQVKTGHYSVIESISLRKKVESMPSVYAV